MRTMRVVTLLTVVITVLLGTTGPKGSFAKGLNDALPNVLSGAFLTGTTFLETTVTVLLEQRLRRHWLLREHFAPTGRR